MDNLNTLIILFKTYQFLFDHVKVTLVDKGINLNEFTAMEALYSKGTLSTRELIKYVLIPNSSMTYVLDNLEKKGYIARERDATDGRMQYISLSKTGETFFKTVFTEHFNHMRKLFDVLSLTEEKELQRLLKIVGLNAQQTRKNCIVEKE